MKRTFLNTHLDEWPVAGPPLALQAPSKFGIFFSILIIFCVCVCVSVRIYRFILEKIFLFCLIPNIPPLLDPPLLQSEKRCICVVWTTLEKPIISWPWFYKEIFSIHWPLTPTLNYVVPKKDLPWRSLQSWKMLTAGIKFECFFECFEYICVCVCM